VRGFSEWIPQDLQLSMLAHVASRGYAIRYLGEESSSVSTSKAQLLDDAEWLETALLT
jgi:hypothetical protein